MPPADLLYPPASGCAALAVTARMVTSPRGARHERGRHATVTRRAATRRSPPRQWRWSQMNRSPEEGEAVARRSLSLTHLTREPTAPAEGAPPLLLLLHGVGSNEADLFGLAPELDGRFFVVSARAPITLGPGAYGWFHVAFTPQGPAIIPAEAEQSRQALLRFIDEVVEAYGVDPRRVYLMGFSQ